MNEKRQFQIIKKNMKHLPYLVDTVLRPSFMSNNFFDLLSYFLFAIQT